MGKISVGVDVGGTSIKLGVFTFDGELIKKWEIRTNKENGHMAVLNDIATTIRATLTELGYSLLDCVGVGMGVPGPVMPDGHVEICVNLHWKDLYPARILSESLDGTPVALSNDANVAALGECWQGGAKGYTDIVMLTLGTGVGGGIVVDGKVVPGRHGIGGEVGHMHVRDEETDACNCGGHGCLEQVASATGIVKEAKAVLSKNPDKSSKLRDFGANLSAKDVLDAAKAGDELAIEVMEVVCRYLGIAISHLAMTTDPDIFVIGGGVSKAGTFLTDMITKYFEYYLPISNNRAKVVLATLGNDAGIYGAAKLLIS